MPTVAELAALAYTGGSPSGDGIVADDYRVQIVHYGETFRWWKAVPVEDPRTAAGAERNGNLYVEQTLASGVKAYIFETQKDEQGGEFGILPRGTTMANLMPDEAWPCRGDRLMLTQRQDRTRILIERGATATDDLLRDGLVSLIEVRQGATVYVGETDYELISNTIHWLTGTPPGIGTKYSVEMIYRPTYVWLPISERMPRRGEDTALLPLRAMLQREILS